VPRREVVRQAEGARAPVRAWGHDARDVAGVYDSIAGRLLELAGLTEGVAR
jgi:hypothetical protein